VSLFLILSAVATWAADAKRGADVLKNERCLECHTVRGAGAEGGVVPQAKPAPDLAGRLAPRYTVAALAASLWNHTPSMWTEMSARVMAQPAPTEADWEDAFLYLYSQQIYDRPGLESRGRQLFRTKNCMGCHSLETGGYGKPVSSWAPVADPATLVFQMWNHADAVGRGQWRRLTGRDLLDITAFIQTTQNVPHTVQFTLPEAMSGRSAFVDHCAKCHTGPGALSRILENRTWADIAAGLWNHVPRVKDRPAMSEADMRGIFSYTWELQYQGPPGRVNRGESLFDDKGCLSCHRSPGTKKAMSPRAKKTFKPVSMVALGWGSGREMHRQMGDKGVKWPHLTAEEVSDLVAYMNTLNR